MKPYIVCLCGSTRFKDDFERLNAIHTRAGRIVLSVGEFGHADSIEHTIEQKAKLDVLHLQKIHMADAIIVVNTGGYVGESTAREIAFARSEDRRVDFAYHYNRYLGKWGENPYVWHPVNELSVRIPEGEES